MFCWKLLKLLGKLVSIIHLWDCGRNVFVNWFCCSRVQKRKSSWNHFQISSKWFFYIVKINLNFVDRGWKGIFLMNFAVSCSLVFACWENYLVNLFAVGNRPQLCGSASGCSQQHVLRERKTFSIYRQQTDSLPDNFSLLYSLIRTQKFFFWCSRKTEVER